MLKGDHPRRPARHALAVLVFLLIPFAAGACITVDSDALATPSRPPSATPAGSSTQAPLASPTPLPTPEPTPVPVAAEVVAFVPYWLLETAAETLDTELVTIAAFHSIEASGDGRLVRQKGGEVPPGWKALESEAFGELKTRLQAAGVKVVPVIGRMGWTEGTRERTISLLSRVKVRRALAGRIARYVADGGFDGVNLDVEPLPEQVADDYAAFVREVRAALDEVDPALHLSIDVTPDLANYDLAALTADDAADLAVLMGYGYRTGASGVAGSTAPLDGSATGSLTATVAGAVAQAPPERLVLGLPWYGIAWPTETDGPGSPVRGGRGIDGAADTPYAGAVELAAVSGREYDPEQASAWTAYATRQCATCPPTWRQLWYDDPDSFGAKVDLALGEDLAGVGMWAAGMEADRGELWWALRERLRLRSDETPPFGSPSIDPDDIEGDIDGRDVVVGSAPLLLFAGDEANGSGVTFARIGLDPATDGSGMLVTGRTYPDVTRIDFPLGDESTGGSAEDGPRSIHVQWRDVAGNWSVPIVIEVHVIDPATTVTPDDL